MEKFASLPEEKQKTIIDAAMESFGRMGYKKASVNDIATAAGISKGMMFHYFGNKKSLYLYLIRLSGDMLMSEMKNRFDKKLTDFFDRIRLATEIKMSVMKKHPAILIFMGSAYFEKEKEVAGSLLSLMPQAEPFIGEIALDGTDALKFKEGIDPRLVLNILVKFAEGYVSGLSGIQKSDIDELLSEFNKCLDLMKNNFYREEYL